MKKRNLLIALVILITFIGVMTLQSIEQHYSKAANIEENQQVKAETDSKLLIGYVQDFRNPNEVDYSKLTHAIFSFAHPTENGDILFTNDASLQNLKQMVSNARQTNTKIMLAVGGWSHINGGQSYDYFQKAISQSTSRLNLINNLMVIVEREGLDGIDIDFEHPHNSLDANYLDLFTKELSERLHSHNKVLSIAVHSKINAATGLESDYVVYEPSTFSYVDYVNIMAYEGQWDEGYHPENSAPYSYAEQSVKYWHDFFTQNDLDTKKLILGVPLYGQPDHVSNQPVSFATIIEEYPAFADKDLIYINGTNYYYNGRETMKKKTRLALDYGFGGMMMWETGLDTNGSDSLTAAIYEELKK
ncbi:glycoside hydrolase family 18 protein [Bacillus massiliigorillae]|uniref:glycoside hydrolase family 18 protein n=1 Tax=Bacillus massiliigorillae TaxID=1243664 RepID=UPI0003A2C402|nr:glycoside hydrolase family 18 protein [Bacillus massiliigorillae]